ncbi:MAG TPA: methyltransferase [Acidimicrobiales bacterium]|jgi:16S rRNA (guanine1207-N2)-methyltransferase|nr:methyltransferase [Acidimicrobiales bacterium]
MAGASGAPHYFEPEPAAGSRRRQVELVLPDVSLRLTTDRGVFAVAGVDPGTKRLLLDGPPLPASATDVLDLGCGYGAIALTTAKRAPHATVWAIDVNRRALALCAENAAANGIRNVRSVEPDEVPDDVRFGVILSNPPIRIGKAALHELLVRWLERLAPDGRAVLVVQQHLGSDSLARWLDDNDWPTRRLSSRAGYRLLEVTRP